MPDNIDNNSPYMLTTLDNPFNPFTQYEQWYEFDTSRGYNTCNYLARIVKTSDELSEIDENLAVQAGIDEIIALNLTGNYIKVTKESFRDRTKDKV